MKIYLKFGNCLKILTLYLTAEKDFPYQCFEETGVIEGVKDFKEVGRKNGFFCVSEPWIALPTLRRFASWLSKERVLCMF